MDTIASQVFGYLKLTVSNLAEGSNQEDVKQDTAKNSSQDDRDEAVLEHDRESVLEVGREKRKQRSLSPSCGVKRQKTGSNSIVVFSGKQHRLGVNMSSQVELEGECSNENSQEKFEEDSVVRLNSIFNQLLWTLKYLKYNPFKTSEEFLEMVETLCSGLQKSLHLSRFSFTDQDFRRFLRIAETLFTLIRAYEEESPLFILKVINKKVENLFDNFLDQFDVDSDGEGHLKTYGFISALIDQTKDEEKIMKQLVKNLLIRVNSTATALWKACISCPKGTVQLVHPEDINLFFYYCQLLELLVTTTSSDFQKCLQESVHESLTALEEDAGSLFSLFPNLAYILYSTILATGIHIKAKTKVSPLKAIQGH